MERNEVPQEVAPLAPHEVVGEKKRLLPPEVLITVNKFLGERAISGYAKILQEEIIKELVGGGMKRADIFKHHWLDFEEVYRDAGWSVTYDKPVYWGGENFEPYFEFRAGR